MLTDKGFLKAGCLHRALPHILPAAGKITHAIFFFFSLGFLQAVLFWSGLYTVRLTIVHKHTSYYLPSRDDWHFLYTSSMAHFLKRLYMGPKALSERCQALIGEPVIFCCWAIDFICIVICWWIQSQWQSIDHAYRGSIAKRRDGGKSEGWIFKSEIVGQYCCSSRAAKCWQFMFYANHGCAHHIDKCTICVTSRSHSIFMTWLSYQEVDGMADLQTSRPPSQWPPFKTVFSTVLSVKPLEILTRF